MAVSKEDLLINIEANTRDAQKSIEDLNATLNALFTAQQKSEDANKKQLSSFQKQVQGLENLQNALTTLAAAYFGIIKPLQAVTSEYMEAQDALTALGNTLRFTGDNISTTVKDFEEFSSALERATGNDGELLISLLKTAKTMGLTNQEAKKYVKTAVDMAAATGGEVSQAFDALRMSTFGNVRALGELRGLVSEFTPEQLKAGAAVEKLSKALDGFSDSAAPTFAKEGKKITAALSELAENIGEVILKVFDLDKPGKSFSTLLFGMADLVKGLSGSFVFLGKVITAPFNAVLAAVFKATGYITAFVSAISDAAAVAPLFGSSTNEALKGVASNLRDISETSKLSADASLEAIFGGASKGAEKLNTEAEKSSSKIKKLSADFEQLRDAGISALDELTKKQSEFLKASEISGKSEIEQARLKAQFDLLEIGALEEKILKAGLMGSKAQEISGNIRTAIVAGFEAAREAALLKTLEDLEKQNQQIAAQNETFGMNTVDRLNKELELQLELIDAQREKLKLEGKYTEGVASSLDQQSALLKESASQKKSVAPSSAAEGVQGFAASMTGPASPLGAVSSIADSIQGLIDFIPNLLSKIANIFNSLTELPTKIMEGIDNVLKSVLNFLGNFIPNLIKAVEGIFESVLDFVQKLPQVVTDLLAKVPDMLLKLFDRLPTLVKGIVKGVLKAIPAIAKALIKFIIEDLPTLTIELVKLIAIELPKALIEGIKAALTGQLFDIPIDTAAISDTFKKMGESLTGDASRLFSVSNLTDQQTGPAEKLKALAENVNKGFKDGASGLAKVWQHWIDVLVSSWRGIIAGLVNLWHGVIDFLNGVISAFKDMFAAVGELLMGIVMGFREMWLFVYNSVILPLINGITSAFSWVVDKVITPLVDFATNLATSIGDIGKKLVDTVGDIGTKLAESFTAGLSGLTDMFTKLGESLIEPIKKVTEGGGGGGGGGLVNKVKKTFGFSEGGIIPGNAKAFGDSARNDFIPAMLSPGEAVIPRSAMQDPEIAEVVRGILSKRGVPSFADGLMPRLASGGGNTEINLGGVVVNTSQAVDADFVRSRLMPTIRNELRRASLDGQTVIYKTGVR